MANVVVTGHGGSVAGEIFIAATPAALVNYQAMWPALLSWIGSFVEKGETIDTRTFVVPS